MSFRYPEVLIAALFILPLFFAFYLLRFRRTALTIFDSSAAKPVTSRSFRKLGAITLVIALALATAALARPEKGFEEFSPKVLARNIFLCADISESMTRKLKINKTGPQKIEIAAKAIVEFLEMRHQNDLIALVPFGTNVKFDLIVPLTSDREVLKEQVLELPKIVRNRTEFTNRECLFWSIILLADEVLRNKEEKRLLHPELIANFEKSLIASPELSSPYEQRLLQALGSQENTVAIFASDGMFNAGRIPLSAQFRLARTLGITVFVIGIGFSNAELRYLAESTGGALYTAGQEGETEMLFSEVSKKAKNEIVLAPEIKKRSLAWMPALGALMFLAIFALLKARSPSLP